MKKALVIQHLNFEDLGSLKPALAAFDYQITTLQAGVDKLADYTHTDYDLVIVLGGPIGVYETDDYPFLLDEIALIQARITENLPTLGICLGAQLIAHALGAKVYAGKQKEIGWKTVFPADAENNVLAPLFHKTVNVLHWHGDTFELPGGATLLASSDLYPNQAFSYQDNILALQFHPEIRAVHFEKWLIGHTLEINHTTGISVQQLRRNCLTHCAKLETAAADVWHNWLTQLNQGK